MYSVTELFSWLERTAEHKVNGIIIYVYKVDESALTTFQENTGQVIMEKCNIVQLVSIKGEESNRYKSNCLLCQRCCLMCQRYCLMCQRYCLMCTSYSEYKRQEHAKT